MEINIRAMDDSLSVWYESGVKDSRNIIFSIVIKGIGKIDEISWTILALFMIEKTINNVSEINIIPSKIQQFVVI